MATKKPAKKSSPPEREREGILYAHVGAETLATAHTWLDAVNAKTRGPKWTMKDFMRRLIESGFAEHGAAGTLPPEVILNATRAA